MPGTKTGLFTVTAIRALRMSRNDRPVFFAEADFVCAFKFSIVFRLGINGQEHVSGFALPDNGNLKDRHYEIYSLIEVFLQPMSVLIHEFASEALALYLTDSVGGIRCMLFKHQQSGIKL